MLLLNHIHNMRYFLVSPCSSEVIYSSFWIQASLNCNIYNPVSVTKCTVSLIISVNLALIFDRLAIL
jgi:hypothetical protein